LKAALSPIPAGRFSQPSTAIYRSIYLARSHTAPRACSAPTASINAAASEVQSRSQRHRPRKLTPAQEAALATHITAHPDLTLAALQAWLLDEHAVRLSNWAMWSAVARLGLSFKKRRSMPPSKIVPTSRPGAASGARRSPLSMPTSSSSSTRPAPAPR
jgi:hypothetical protein